MSLFHNDEKDPRKKFFHHESVSVPISAPVDIGFTNTYSIPFGPPVIHAEPEKTLDITRHEQQLHNQGSNGFFFNIAGRSIVPDGFRSEGDDDDDDEDVVMEIVGEIEEKDRKYHCGFARSVAEQQE